MTIRPPLVGLEDFSLRERTRVVLALAQFRCELQMIADGESLLKVETPIGLLLSDIADRLELTSQERHVVLGGNLIIEVDAFWKQRVRRKVLV